MAFACIPVVSLSIQSSHQDQYILTLASLDSLSEVLVLEIPTGDRKVWMSGCDGHVGVCVVVGGDVPVRADVSTNLVPGQLLDRPWHGVGGPLYPAHVSLGGPEDSSLQLLLKVRVGRVQVTGGGAPHQVWRLGLDWRFLEVDFR